MKNSWFGILTFASIASLFSLFSCVSTETIEPEMLPVEKSDELVLNLSAPSALKTRAHEGYYLRYVAKIAPMDASGSTNYKKIQRAEILENQSDNKIVFKVTPNTKYQIIVFADYISNPDTLPGGVYQDCFYNTNLSKLYNDNSFENSVQMYTSFEDTSTDKFSKSFFNNDNYDCFYKTQTEEKGVEQLIVPIELTRAVAKVEFRDTTKNPGVCKDISFSKLGLQIQYNLASQIRTTSGPPTIESLDGIANDSTLFSFYCFAQPSNPNSPINFDINFTTTINDPEKSKENEGTKIPLVTNCITRVKGEFLISLDVANGNGKQDDEIILDVSKNTSWANAEVAPF